MSNLEIEEGQNESIDFSKIDKMANLQLGVIPAVAQHAETGEVLIIAYANRQAVENSLKSRLATFFSTSRNELWIKGNSSGDALIIDKVLVNCEQNSVLYLVRPEKGTACHTTRRSGERRVSCFYRELTPSGLKFLEGRE